MGWAHDGMYGSGVGAGLMWLLLLLFWAALIGLIVFLVVKLTGHPAAPPAADSPERVVDLQFARGEIDEETYRARRAALAEMNRP